MQILKRLQPKAIAAGFLLELISSTIIGMALVTTLMMLFLFKGGSSPDIYVSMTNAGRQMAFWPHLPLIIFGVRVLSKLASGAFVAQMAQEAPYLNAAATALLSIAFSLFRFWLSPPTLGASYVMLSLCLTLPLVMIGTHWRVKILNRHGASPASQSPIPDVPRI
jgi:hypothetical protein